MRSVTAQSMFVENPCRTEFGKAEYMFVGIWCKMKLATADSIFVESRCERRWQIMILCFFMVLNEVSNIRYDVC